MPRRKAPTSAPILKDNQVKELLTILRDNNLPSTADFLTVLNQMSAMERQLDAAVKELAAVRQELKTVQEQNHPVKAVLLKTSNAMQSQVFNLREQLSNLKQTFIEGCKQAVADFKEKGVSTLDNTMRFFKIRPALETMKDNLDKWIQLSDKAIVKIEAISTEYHQAGKHLKNMGRAAMGKEAIEEVKQPGRLANAISAPFRMERSHFTSLKKQVEQAIGAVTRLEERTAEKKPSIRQAIENHHEKKNKEAPAMERPRSAHVER
ncbi:DUF6674 family protein [Paenibacillus sp. RS8]|uniref:DUF6674 family protein n=1 Tax=Paenibacillus sp. RS8 TaxID=3242681 RepID=UPI0035C0A450